MPDKLGFHDLGDRGLLCIDCPTRFPRWTPEKERERHARTHRRDRAEAAAQSAEQLRLIRDATDQQAELL